MSSDPSETILAGGSRGGLAATCAALQYPSIFGNVISQSGQFTWPAGDSELEEENEKTDQEYGWLMRQYGARARLPIQFYLAVGLLERGPYSFLMANRHLRDVLKAKGYTVYYREFSGGHEDIHWRNTLPEALLALLGTETERVKGEKSQIE